MNPLPESSAVHLALIEDNDLDVRLIGAMLLDAGHGRFVLSAVYGRLEEGIEGIRRRGGIDLILADLSLPDSNGIDTLRRLCEAISHLPIIVLSGNDDESLAIGTVHEGAQDYLVKNDLTGRLLARSIFYAIERKRTELELQIARSDLERRVEERTRALQESNRQLAGTLKQLTHWTAQRHDAKVDIESSLGEGSEVTIRFPACQPPEERDAPLPPVRGLRILAAEDEPMIREILGVYLGEDAHRVEMAADGTEALRKLGEGKFDLVITDYSMPGVSGDKVAQAARAGDKTIRVLMLTGFGDMLTQRGMPRLAVDALISKPFTFESLRGGIAKAMAG